MNKALISIIGFALFLFGFLALILSLVGLQLSFLTFIDQPGPLFGFLARLFMIFVGIALVYVSRLPEEDDDMPL